MFNIYFLICVKAYIVYTSGGNPLYKGVFWNLELLNLLLF